MTTKLAMDLAVLLPDAPDANDGCVGRLSEMLHQTPGVEQVHVIEDGDDPPRVCFHVDQSRITVARVRQLAVAAGAQLAERYHHEVWTVEGISSRRRARAAAEHLARQPGVLEASASPDLLRVEYDTQQVTHADLVALLERRNVRVVEKGTAAKEGSEEHHHGGPFGERSELVFAVASGALWLLGVLLDLTAAPAWIPTALYITAGLAGGYFTVREAVESIRDGRFEIDFLMIVAAAGAWTLGKWEEGALLLALFSIGHALEGYAMGRASRAIEALSDIAPRTAIVRRNGTETEIPIEELSVAETIVVKANERIPSDGFVVEGASSVDQAPVTGESIPVDKIPVSDIARAAAAPDQVAATSRVFAGTLNGPGSLVVQITRTAADSTLSRMAQLVREAETQTSPTQRFADRFERIFVPAVIALVAVVLAVGIIVDGSFSDAFYRSMAVLVAASPCALAIATPSAVLAGVARAAQLGVLIKGGGPLENLGRIRSMAFDKTGTLTIGRPVLIDVVPLGGAVPNELLALTSAVESRSDHPLAAAVVEGAWKRFPDLAVPAATDVRSVVGKGVEGRVDGALVRIGRSSLFADGTVPPNATTAVEQLQAQGRTTMLVEREGLFLGVLGLMDTPRPAAAGAVAALRNLGMRRMVMLSGDNSTVAGAIARDVGLDEAWGDLMPDDKVTSIESLLASEGSVAMVGDGVNDGPALARATVGISMGAAGSDVALETADVALMGDDLAGLPAVVALSRRGSRTIRQNLTISLAMVAVLIPATIIGVVGIGPAVVFHEGSTLVVVGNALRLLAFRPPRLDSGGAAVADPTEAAPVGQGATPSAETTAPPEPR